MPIYAIANLFLLLRGYDQNASNGRCLRAGQPLDMSPEPMNRYDKTAVVVSTMDTSPHIIGRVPKHLSKQYTEMLDWIIRLKLQVKVSLIEVPNVEFYDENTGKRYPEHQAKIKIEYLTVTIGSKHEKKYTRLANLAKKNWPSIKLIKVSPPVTPPLPLLELGPTRTDPIVPCNATAKYELPQSMVCTSSDKGPLDLMMEQGANQKQKRFDESNKRFKTEEK